MFEDLDLDAIHEENARELIKRLLNWIEQLSADLRDDRAENQRLRDEVNRLKEEQGKPKIKGNKPKPPAGDHSSDSEQHRPKRHAKGGKRAAVHIDREEVVDPQTGCQLWPAHPGGCARLGYLHDLGSNCQKIGDQLLCLYS